MVYQIPVSLPHSTIYKPVLGPFGMFFSTSFLDDLFCVVDLTFTLLRYAQNSAKIIRASVFGMDENKKVREKFMFPQNNLVVTSIDIQSVEPVDQRTRDSLQKSVQLAIEITTNSQEAAARSVHPAPYL